MGNIDFIGFTQVIKEIEITNIPLPNNAIKITEYADDISLYNCTLAVVPIITMIIFILIFKFKKYSIKKDFKENIKKYLEKYDGRQKWRIIMYIELKLIIFSIFFLCFTIIFHELIHVICEYFFNKNVIIGFDVTSMIAYVKSLSPTYTKFEKITILIMPIIITGIFPIIVCFLKLKKSKNKVIIVILILFLCSNIAVSCSDLIDVYNYIRFIPNGAIIQKYDNDTYFIQKQQ